MKQILGALSGLLLASAAPADGWNPDRLYVPLASYHINIDPPAASGMTNWNEVNPGLIFTWEERLWTLDYSAGAYLNSYEDVSAIFSVGKFWDVGQVSQGAIVSFADYHDNARFFDITLGSTDFVVLPAVQMNWRNFFVQLVPAPQFNGDDGAVLGFGATFALGD